MVYSKYVLDGEVTTLQDTLTVITTRNDGKYVMLNKLINQSEFVLPVSYGLPEDTLFFMLTNSNSNTRIDTVRLRKTSVPHFESVDCSPTYFHTINGVNWTRHAIDSIIISKTIINYDTTGGHLRIYFKPGD